MVILDLCDARDFCAQATCIVLKDLLVPRGPYLVAKRGSTAEGHVLLETEGSLPLHSQNRDGREACTTPLQRAVGSTYRELKMLLLLVRTNKW